MGIIQKQAVRTTTVIFAGLGIGILSRMLMPFILTKEQIGVLALIESVSNLVSHIFCLGFVQIVIRAFPKHRNEATGHDGFLMFGVYLTLIGSVLGMATYLLLRPIIFGPTLDGGLLEVYAILIAPIILFRIVFKNFDSYMRILFSTTVGAALESFLLKLVIFVGLLLYWFEQFQFESLVYTYVVAFALPGGIILYLSFAKTLKVVWPSKRLFQGARKKELFQFGLFGVLIQTTGILVLTIDQLMLGRMLSVADVGVYSVLFVAGMIVNVPSRGVKRVASTILAEAWNKQDLDEIDSVYGKSSISNLVSGIFLFVVGWACLDHALHFLPSYQYGKFVFLFIGIAQLVEMSTGVNQEIIAASEKYRANTYLTVVLGALVVICNMTFIPKFGITGAALASLGAILVINIIRLIYVYVTFNIQPFDRNTAKALVVGTLFFCAAQWNPVPTGSIVLLIGYITVFCSAYWLVSYRLNISPDINVFLLKIKRRFIP